MIPTPKLRFVSRDLGYTQIRVLQQWWEPHWIEGNIGVPKGEWRDVPIERE